MNQRNDRDVLVEIFQSVSSSPKMAMLEDGTVVLKDDQDFPIAYSFDDDGHLLSIDVLDMRDERALAAEREMAEQAACGECAAEDDDFEDEDEDLEDDGDPDGIVACIMSDDPTAPHVRGAVNKGELQ